MSFMTKSMISFLPQVHDVRKPQPALRTKLASTPLDVQNQHSISYSQVQGSGIRKLRVNRRSLLSPPACRFLNRESDKAPAARITCKNHLRHKAGSAFKLYNDDTSECSSHRVIDMIMPMSLLCISEFRSLIPWPSLHANKNEVNTSR
jgi:hypothetical protein